MKLEFYEGDVATIKELRRIVNAAREMTQIYDLNIYIRARVLEDAHTGDLIFGGSWEKIDTIGYATIVLNDVDGHTARAKVWNSNPFDVKITYNER